MKKYVLITVGLTALLFVGGIFFLITNKPKTVTPPVPQISVQEKKANFKVAIIPAINKTYTALMEQYLAVEIAMGAGTDSKKIATLKQQYKAETDEELLMALKPHPQSIAIAQAALESSWATSRFYREANNIFGVWSFSENEPRIAAGEKRGDKTIWVKKYASTEASVQDYYRTIARGQAFKEFRQLKMETSDPFELVKKLDKYSELGAKYGEELTSIIKFNKFDTYDKM